MNSKIFSVSFLVVGLVAGYLYGSSSVKSEYEIIFEKVKSVLPALPEEIKSLTGPVQEVGEDYLTIKTAGSGNPLEEWPEIRKVLITEKTQIIRVVSKELSVIKKEMADFQKESTRLLASGKNLPPPPVSFEEKEINLSDIKVGEIVMVESSVNIKTSSEFEASSLRINSPLNPGDTTPPPTVPIN